MSKTQNTKSPPESPSSSKPPQPGEQSRIAPGGDRKGKEGTVEKQGNVEPQQG